jgi:hypothetical protein
LSFVVMAFNRITVLIAALAIAATVAVAPLAIRGSLRFYALNKVLRLPQAQARLAVKPTRRTLSGESPVRLINLGYATFDIGSTNQLFMETTPSGASVVLTNRDVYMAFLPPFAPHKPTGLGFAKIPAGEARTHPTTLARMKEWEGDQMAAEMAWEETQPLPLSKILFMSNDDFLLYSLKVAFKAGNSNGSKEVQFFQSPYAKGIVRVGKSTNDSRFAAVFLASLDGAKNVGLLLEIRGLPPSSLSNYLDPILRSFRFTVEIVDDREAIKALIRRVGIPQRRQTPSDE